MAKSGLKTRKVTLASSPLGIATTVVLRNLISHQANGQFLQFRRSLTQVKNKESLHARTSTRLISSFTADRQRIFSETLWRFETCTGHGVLECSPLLSAQMTLVSWQAPTGSRTRGSCAFGAPAAPSRKRLLRLLRRMNVQTV